MHKISFFYSSLPTHHFLSFNNNHSNRWASQMALESACQCRRHKRFGFNPWVRKIPWSKWQFLLEEMAIHSSILVWKIPWTDKPVGLQSMGSQRVGHDWATEHTHSNRCEVITHCDFDLHFPNDCAKAFDCVDDNKLWKILKEMGIPDHLTCLLRNPYAGQEATVRTGHGKTDWFQIGKGISQVCILLPCLFNLYAKYIMRNTGWSTSWNQDCQEKY